MLLALLTIIFSLIFYLIYRRVNADKDVWEKRGIPHNKDRGFFGLLVSMLLMRKSFFDLTREQYSKYTEKLIGTFQMLHPVLILRDPELVKKICIKDFDHFLNHQNMFAYEDPNDLFSSSLIQLNDDKWKAMRNALSPAFTGSKMRKMFCLIQTIANNAVRFLKDVDGIEIDFKDFSTRFANDVIASTAFGLDIDSFANKTNEFYTMLRKTTDFSYKQFLKFIMMMVCRSLAKFLKLQFIPKETNKYFLDLVVDAMKYRKEHNIKRPDMINILMEISGMQESEHSKASNRQWSDIDLAAQSFLFLFAGFETVSVPIIFTAHELVENPNVQEKLYDEIEAVVEQLNGESLTYEILQSMKYLDMVVSESLRKWPPSFGTDRLCNKDIEYELDDGLHVKILKGDLISLPIVGFHYNPEFFPNPDAFDPERFSDENKSKIQHGSYLPFGLGPRSCIANRFALMEVKALFFYVLCNFEITKGAKTSSPLRVSRSSKMIPEGGSWLKFKARKRK